MKKNKQHVGILFLCIVLTALLGGGIVGVILVVLNQRDIYNILIGNNIYSMIFSQIILVLPTIIYLIVRKDVKKIRVKPVKISVIILSFLFAFMITPLMSWLNIFSQIFVDAPIQDTMKGISNTSSFIPALIVMAVIPAVFEEITFRGVFYNNFRKKGILIGGLFSGITFGLVHMNFNQFAYAFVMGVLFSMLVEATDSIVTSMIVHFTINGTSVANMYFMDTTATDTLLQKSDIISMFISYTPVVLIATALACVTYWGIAVIMGRWTFIKTNLLKNVDMNVEDDSKKIMDIPFVIAMILSLICMILVAIV